MLSRLRASPQLEPLKEAYRSLRKTGYLPQGRTFESFCRNAPPDANHGCELERLFYGHTGRLVHKWHHYLRIYDRLIAPLRATREPVRMIEIGVSHGGSLQLWRDYLGEDAMIAGLDVDHRCGAFSEGNTRVFIGSQDDRNVVEDALSWLGPPHLVIDDGSHSVKHQHATFDILFPAMEFGGIYICEDLHTNYWRHFGGGYRKTGTFIERMKRAVDDMHEWSHRYGARDATIARQAFALHFYEGLIAIEKEAITEPCHIRIGEPSFQR